MHDFAIVGVGAESAYSTPTEAVRLTHNTMTWTPTATRADVVRMVARYVRLEFSIRSGAGRLAIDESRVTKRRGGEDVVDISVMSWTEIVEASRNWRLRQAVTAKPEEPMVTSSDPLTPGMQLRRVAPLRDVTQIVKLKSRLGGGVAPQASAREWRATVAQKISRASAQSLITAEQLRLSLKEIRNQLEAARRADGRLKSGGKKARNLKRLTTERVAELREKEHRDSERLRSIVKTGEYLLGVDRLLAVCTKTEEIESYCFGEAL